MERAHLPAGAAAETARADTAAKLDWKSRKEEEARKRKLQNDILKLEQRIAELEEEDARIDALFEDPEITSDAKKLTDLSRQKEEVTNRLEEAYARWEALQE